MTNLSPQEEKVLKYIKKYHKETGIVPTSIAVGNYLGVSGQRARQHIKSLKEKGALLEAVRNGLYRLAVDN